MVSPPLKFKKFVVLLLTVLFIRAECHELAQNIHTNGASKHYNRSVQAGTSYEGSLTSTFETTTGQHGIMFDVVSKSSEKIEIVDFDVNIISVSQPRLEVYTRDGTSKGHENGESGWDLVANSTIQGAGHGNLSNVGHTSLQAMVLKPFTTRALYITIASNDAYIAYAIGTNTGAVYCQDSSIQILEGVGKFYPFGVTSPNRVFSGTIYYTYPSSEPSIVPSYYPSFNPSFEPSEVTSSFTTTLPSNKPSLGSTISPSAASGFPSQKKSLHPSNLPTTRYYPSHSPVQHRKQSSRVPSRMPAVQTSTPSNIPSHSPTRGTSPPQVPSIKPTISRTPTANPSLVRLLTKSPTVSLPSARLSKYPVLMKPSLIPSLRTNSTTSPSLSVSNAPSLRYLQSTLPSDYSNASIVKESTPLSHNPSSQTLSNHPSIERRNIPSNEPYTLRTNTPSSYTTMSQSSNQSVNPSTRSFFEPSTLPSYQSKYPSTTPSSSRCGSGITTVTVGALAAAVSVAAATMTVNPVIGGATPHELSTLHTLESLDLEEADQNSNKYKGKHEEKCKGSIASRRSYIHTSHLISTNDDNSLGSQDGTDIEEGILPTLLAPTNGVFPVRGELIAIPVGPGAKNTNGYCVVA